MHVSRVSEVNIPPRTWLTTIECKLIAWLLNGNNPRYNSSSVAFPSDAVISLSIYARAYRFCHSVKKNICLCDGTCLQETETTILRSTRNYNTLRVIRSTEENWQFSKFPSVVLAFYEDLRYGLTVGLRKIWKYTEHATIHNFISFIRLCKNMSFVLLSQISTLWVVCHLLEIFRFIETLELSIEEYILDVICHDTRIIIMFLRMRNLVVECVKNG